LADFWILAGKLASGGEGVKGKNSLGLYKVILTHDIFGCFVGLGATALKEFQRTSAVLRTHSKQLTKTK